MKRLSIYLFSLIFVLASCASKPSTTKAHGNNTVKNSLEPILNQEYPEMENKIKKNWEKGRNATIIISLCYDQRFGDSTVSDVSAWIQAKLEELFVNADYFNVIDKTNIEKIIKEQKFQSSVLVDENQMTEVGRLLGGDYIVFSKINQFGKLELKITKVETAQLIYSKTCTTFLEEITDINVNEPIFTDISDLRPYYEGIVLRISKAAVPAKYNYRLIKVGPKHGIEYYTSIETPHSDTEWGTRFVETGKQYSVQLSYYDDNGLMKDYNFKTIVVAKKGVGELECVQYVDYEFVDDTIVYTQQPKITLGGKPIDEDFIRDNYEFYIHANINNRSNNWEWLSCSNDVDTFELSDRKIRNFERTIKCKPEDDLVLRAHLGLVDSFNEYGGCNLYLYKDSDLQTFNITN